MKIINKMRNDYLQDEYVQGFVGYLADVISGKVPVDISVSFSRIKLPPDFTLRFVDGVSEGKGPAAVYTLQCGTLQAFYDMYWWDRKYYADNAETLDVVKAKIRAAIDAESTVTGHSAALDAIHEVMKWGFGQGTRAYRKNMEWAESLGADLVPVLKLGRESLTGSSPDISVFAPVNPNVAGSKVPRMNAGWTKYYALALPDFIIYDGRVGAAMGFLARRYLESMPPTRRPAVLPESLAFRWAAGQGNNLRDPSSTQYKFPSLKHIGKGPQEWAQVNVQANWILAAACNKAQASWVSGPDGLRKLEAALFMLGYDFSKVEAVMPSMKSSEQQSVISLPYGGSFDPMELIDYIKSQGRDYIIQGQQACTMDDHSKPQSLDFWLRTRASQKNTKQATNEVIRALVETGAFIEVDELPCPDNGRLCKGIRITS